MKLRFICLLVSCLSFGQNEELETFTWQEDRQLQWSDFRGQPDQNSIAAALSASGIGFGFSMTKTGNKITGFETKVDCVFYPTESWYKSEDATPLILRHEQFHFNITELFARKFRYQISKIKSTQNLRDKLNLLYKNVSEASYEMQNKYDHETDHSIIKEKQIAWELYITAELKKLEAFKTE